MTPPATVTRRAGKTRRALLLAGLAALTVGGTVASDARAQGWWPWANQDQPPPRRDIRPPAPIPNQLPPPGGAVAPGQQPGFRPAPGASGNICLQLEQRLVAEGQNRGTNPREALSRVEMELRQTEKALQQAQGQLDRGDCFEYFLFSKSLRNTPACRTAQGNADQLRRRMSELDQQRTGLASAGERRVSDDIVRELARNGCGQQYVQEARRLDNTPSNPFWATEEDTGPRTGGNQFGSLPFATYRTICVRLCDGYFFPVSFSTLPNHFSRDADTCQQKCAAPVELFYHQNPGANVEQAVSVKSNANYTSLKSAFRYRKEFVHGCSCKEAEYQPGSGERPTAAATVPAKKP
jgi:hypothetical protein